ncbi:MAG TPA: TIM-barrel domain-containing protein [Candidatus Acidoferrales bacterium]|nr:TIM-barrel domain-containing protein [Candidatus Acidoferrales bacterium]
MQSVNALLSFSLGVIAALIPVRCSAELPSLASESFDYAPNNLSGQNGGAGWGGPWQDMAGKPYIDVDNLLAGDHAPAGFDASSKGNYACASGNSRAGRKLDVSPTGSFARLGYLHTNGCVGAPGKRIYLSFVMQPGTSAKFYEFELHRGSLADEGRIAGIGNDTDTANVNLRLPDGKFQSLGRGETKADFYVVRIDFKSGRDDLRVYRNPISQIEPATPTLSALGAGDLSFDGIAFAGWWDSYLWVDEIRIGTNWTEAIGSPAPGSPPNFQVVAVTNVALVGQGIAEFEPTGYDHRKTPSLALVTEPKAVGHPGSKWALRPDFYTDNGQNDAALRVPAGTSLYGGGEVTGPLLRNGRRIELWNTDAGGYGIDQGQRLYQSHPWVLGVRPDGTAFGVLFDSSWKATLTTDSDEIRFHSCGPPFRVLVIDRDSPQAVVRGLGELTGTISMPPRWALGYQQCRWSYQSAEEVRQIADTFRTKQIPCDAIWMDIDYMDGFRVFTFNPRTFPDPAGLNNYLHGRGFHSVWMIDPGVKFDPGYSVYQSGSENDAWVKKGTGGEFHGDVWPGACVFPDFTRPETRAWWAELYSDYLAKGIDGVWNDMNEPSVFNTYSKTMPYDNWHRGGGGLPAGPHLMYHNAYGRLMVQATYEGISAAKPDRRPFVLSRANFLGGQRYAATWTGDNLSRTNLMEMSVPMTLTLGLSGQPFNGPDLGGFADDATPELWASWVGFGVFFPFARGHACAGTNRKEPWAFGPAVEETARIALERRYRLLPYWYTLFHQSHLEGLPVMQPVFFADTQDLSLRAEDQAFLVGGDLLVVPAWAKSPALPKGVWRLFSLVDGDDGPNQALLKIRGGAIIPLGNQVQNTTENVLQSPTLLVCPDENGRASGSLYWDAGEGWEFKSGAFSQERFSAQQTGHHLTVRMHPQDGRQAPAITHAQVEVIAADGVHLGNGTLESGLTVSW